ncbi:perlucin-like [Ylistrum balloti]|uniref:perlucin-like n=1 Tax=Ylistrum balloti TaxID=509963 RepID=UPI0029057EEE|nr:perlucin-like [Ylistrum balloti]
MLAMTRALFIFIFIQIDVTYNQNILPEHQRRHCNALKTMDIMEYAMPEIRRILRQDAANLERKLKEDFGNLERTLKEDFGNLERTLKEDFGNLERTLKEDFGNLRDQYEQRSFPLKGSFVLTCPAGWVYYNYSCYLFSSTRTTWRDGRGDCQSKEAYLAEILSEEENNFVQSELRRIKEPEPRIYSLGGTDIHSEGVWLWVSTGERIGFTDWGPKEPNNQKGKEHCLTINGFLDYRWNDDNCANEFNWICERSVVVQPYL